MAYLGKYIRQILSRQEQVILPGFGSLVISKSTGAISSGGRIDPPGVLIRFDGEHPRDDGKLAGEYSEGEGIDPEEASQQVLELVDAIKFKLDKGEPFRLDLVGTFTRDDSNRIHFERDPNWIIDPDLFGLPPLDLLELEEEDSEERRIAEETNTVKDLEPKRVEKPIVQNEPPKVKRKMANRAPVNKWKIIWIIVGSLIAVLVLILLIPTKNSDYGIEFSKEGIVMKENVVRDDQGETVISGQDLKENNDEVQQDDQDGAQPDIEPLAEVTNNFFIIAGSFQGLQNATELMESLEAEGFPAEIIFTESRLYRVAVKSYPEKQQAIDDLKQIKAHPGLGSCWVWSR